MKLVIQIVFILIILSCNNSNLKKIADEELINMIVKNRMPNPEDIEIYNMSGNAITLDSLKSLEITGKYFEDFYANKNGEIVRIVIRDKTSKDELLIARINKKLNEAPELKPVDIDCDDKINILQTVFDRDQEMRRGENSIDPQIDHENLEIIVSFIEKCGMPTLNEVNDIQMAGIWAVLQHAPAEYQSKYISLLEESANKGDVKWSVIALMKDKALMYEGKPQIYGSQINNGELYELFEPEYVNQRRAKIGMEPIEEYLQRFDLEFNVEQQTK